MTNKSLHIAILGSIKSRSIFVDKIAIYRDFYFENILINFRAINSRFYPDKIEDNRSNVDDPIDFIADKIAIYPDFSAEKCYDLGCGHVPCG